LPCRLIVPAALPAASAASGDTRVPEVEPLPEPIPSGPPTLF
jgi:hypothetical protein